MSELEPWIAEYADRWKGVPMANESTCKKCKAPIVWGKTSAGRYIPLNPVPQLNGNLARDKNGNVEYVRPDPETRRYISHFADCPNAGDFRSRGRK